uniref:Ig-like domain-containing protein n=1 Tax=Pygocentrus nattereri TaxID=42514 RepID=A0AAR2JZW5_PYGNA
MDIRVILSVLYRASVVLGVERSVCCGLHVVLLVRMFLTFCLLFIGLHVSDGCILVNRSESLRITAYTGGSVLLPCYCTDLHTKPQTGFTWKYNTKGDEWEKISSESGQYRDRVQLVNGQSQGNLSLLISHLTEEDGGQYQCYVQAVGNVYITLTVKGCTLINLKSQTITAHIGGSVLLPCSCPDLQTTPKGFTWEKRNVFKSRWEVISSESGQYRDRVQLFNGHSPGNLSLLISHLTEEDGGEYRCGVKQSEHIYVRINFEEDPSKSTAVVNVQTRPTTSIPSSSSSSQTPEGTAFSQTASLEFFIFIPVLLLLAVGGVFYWRYRAGQRRVQMESGEQRGRKEQGTQDEVMYSTVVHSNTARTPTATDAGDKTEYATIRVN